MDDPFQTGQLKILTVDQIKQITKALSLDRRKLNQRVEQINRSIEEQSHKIESLKLVGGEIDETLDELHRLTDLGQEMSLQLQKLDSRLKKARQMEDRLKGRPRVS